MLLLWLPLYDCSSAASGDTDRKANNDLLESIGTSIESTFVSFRRGFSCVVLPVSAEAALEGVPWFGSFALVADLSLICDVGAMGITEGEKLNPELDTRRDELFPMLVML